MKDRSKISVGNDEFCPSCMEWREYDEEGRCKKCRRLIKKGVSEAHKTTDEFDLHDFDGESGEE
jgi:hypothetical protein